MILTQEQRAAVETVVKAEHSAVWDADAEAAFDGLLTDRLIFKVVPADGIKTYMFFSSAGGALAQPRDRIVDALTAVASEAGFSQVSIYSGVGFADFVLKGWCSQFADILPAVNRVRRVAKDLRLAPWTLIVADGAEKDSGETIDAVQAELPAVLEEFLRDAAVLADMLPPLRRELASLLNPIDQDSIVAHYRSARELLSRTDLQRFVEIVGASLVRDRKLFNRSLSYLTSIEEDLRTVVPRTLSRIMGDGWYQAAKKSGWLSTEERNDDLDQEQGLSLASLLFLLAAASDELPEVARVTEHFPRDWRQRIRELLALRNSFAHGSLWDLARTREFAGRWGERLPAIATSIGLQTALEEWAEQNI